VKVFLFFSDFTLDSFCNLIILVLPLSHNPTTPPMEKAETSAIVVSPPPQAWEPIQDIRVKHDKAYSRWMPHINLIFPFVPGPSPSSIPATIFLLTTTTTTREAVSVRSATAP